MRLNASLLKVWQTCALQAKFQFEDERPRPQNAKASFGTIIHKCLENYNIYGDAEGSTEMFKDLWAHPEKAHCKPDYWPRKTDYAGLRTRGIEILDAYHATNKWTSRQIVATEHRFLVPFGDHELSGIVDLVEFKKAGNGHKQLRVIDYKTNAKQPWLDSLRYDIQFTCYVYASLQPEFWTGVPGTKYRGLPDGLAKYKEYEKVTRKAIWYHLWTNKEIDAGNRDDGDFERLYRLAEQIDLAQKAKIYIPTINGESCVWCDYTDVCRYVIPVKRQMVEDGEIEEDEEETTKTGWL